MLTSHSRMGVGMDGALQTHKGKGSNAGAQRCCWSCNFQAWCVYPKPAIVALHR